MLIIATHSTSIKGKIYEAPTSTLLNILKEDKKDFIFFRHSIDGSLPTMVHYFSKGILTKSLKLNVMSRYSIFRYLSEIISTLYFVLFSVRKNVLVYVGVDPLNAFSGIILKKIGRVSKVVYYTADFTTKRFSNPLLNIFYHLLDRICINNADFVWNVSTRICEIRKKQGLPSIKNIFVPNIPFLGDSSFLYQNTKRRYSLISLGIIGEQMDYLTMFDAVKDLLPIYPDLILRIVGNGPKEVEYKAYVSDIGLNGNVLFLGHLSHENALEEISKSEIGLAVYNGKWGFNYYGDSMKCREYFCFGLPVITTDTHSTVSEIIAFQAGIVCSMDKNMYKNAISNIFDNYEAYSNSSRRLGNNYSGVHQNLLRELCE
jgi:glycosyltransferase involved in cell wall biosynthesis